MSLERKLQELRSVARNCPRNYEKAESFVDLVESGSPYAELFYSELDDPEWIQILESRGVFQACLDSLQNADGSTSYPRSLPLQGLARLAAKAPEAAANIIVKFPRFENVVVGDQMMRCMLAIHDPGQASKLLPVAEKLISRRGFSTRLYLRDLLKNWVTLGRIEEALRLLTTFIDTIVRAEPKFRRDQQSVWELSECDNEILAPLMTEDLVEVANICFKGLSAYYDASYPRSQKQNHDFEGFLDAVMDDPQDLTYWLEDFRETAFRRDDPGAILAHRLYTALLLIY